MAEKNIILHWSRVYHEIFQNSILSAYVPKKNILIAPWRCISFFEKISCFILSMNMFTMYPIILINILFESISYFFIRKVVVG
jgi:hypothetical protein